MNFLREKRLRLSKCWAVYMQKPREREGTEGSRGKEEGRKTGIAAGLWVPWTSGVVQFCFSNFLARRAHTLATPTWVAPSSEKPQFPRRKNNMRGSLTPKGGGGGRRSGIHINCPISFPPFFSAHGRSERVKVEFGNKDDAIYGKRHFISFWIPQSQEFLRNMPYILWGNTFALGATKLYWVWVCFWVNFERFL